MIVCQNHFIKLQKFSPCTAARISCYFRAHNMTLSRDIHDRNQMLMAESVCAHPHCSKILLCTRRESRSYYQLGVAPHVACSVIEDDFYDTTAYHGVRSESQCFQFPWMDGGTGYPIVPRKLRNNTDGEVFFTIYHLIGRGPSHSQLPRAGESGNHWPEPRPSIGPASLEKAYIRIGIG